MAVTIDLDRNGPKPNLVQIGYVELIADIAAKFQRVHKAQKRLEALEDEEEREVAYKDYLEAKEACSKTFLEIYYGGGIRGGKTYGGIACLILLCKAFPMSRWIIVRKSKPALENAITSMSKIIGNAPNVYWKRGQKEYYVQFSNGSRIYFVPENYNQDKELTKFLGMEFNGVLFEQLEEITQKGFNMIKSRVGSWYNVKGAMPPALILGNFNPTYGWLKNDIYDKWKKGDLESYRKFIIALAEDNPHVTDEQRRSWDTLDEMTKARMIRGEWDIKVSNAFLYSFNIQNHTKQGLTLDPLLPIYLSFDFNVDPMTCVMFQTDERTFFRVIHAFKQSNSDTYALCREIKRWIEGREYMVRVTGDASGKNRISGTDGAINQYQIIQRQLGLKDRQFMLPSFNPPIADRRTFCNSIIEFLDEFSINENLDDLIQDVQFTTCSYDNEGDLKINKNGTNEYLGIDNRHMGHLMDCLTYGMMLTLAHLIKYHRS